MNSKFLKDEGDNPEYTCCEHHPIYEMSKANFKPAFCVFLKFEVEEDWEGKAELSLIHNTKGDDVSPII